MEQFILITTNTFPAFYNGDIIIGNLTFYLLLFGFLIFPLGIFFVARYFKKEMAINQNTLSGKINLLEEKTRIFLKEQNSHSVALNSLKEKLAEIENKLNRWDAEKAELEKEIKNLKTKIQNHHKNDDIIIEYYMKDKPDE